MAASLIRFAAQTGPGKFTVAMAVVVIGVLVEVILTCTEYAARVAAQGIGTLPEKATIESEYEGSTVAVEFDAKDYETMKAAATAALAATLTFTAYRYGSEYRGIIQIVASNLANKISPNAVELLSNREKVIRILRPDLSDDAVARIVSKGKNWYKAKELSTFSERDLRFARARAEGQISKINLKKKRFGVFSKLGAVDLGIFLGTAALAGIYDEETEKDILRASLGPYAYLVDKYNLSLPFSLVDLAFWLIIDSQFEGFLENLDLDIEAHDLVVLLAGIFSLYDVEATMVLDDGFFTQIALPSIGMGDLSVPFMATSVFALLSLKVVFSGLLLPAFRAVFPGTPV